jgi:hypothetical protein
MIFKEAPCYVTVQLAIGDVRIREGACPSAFLVDTQTREILAQKYECSRVKDSVRLKVECEHICRMELLL